MARNKSEPFRKESSTSRAHHHCIMQCDASQRLEPCRIREKKTFSAY
ncbi:zinc-finger domain-containing protein [Dyella acidisoli]